MVLMLWLYISGLVLIIGAEMNAEIEHASPHGKAPGEKVPGQRKTIGPRAAREFRERQRQGGGPAPRPAPVIVQPRPAPVTAFARTGVLVSGALAALFGRRVRS
jgi:membrane protein